MTRIGNLGHISILLPGSLILIALLLSLGRRADALAFVEALAVCLTAMLFAKIAFYACESNVPAFGIKSPSGHASLSAFFYGCLALVAVVGRPHWQRAAIYLGTTLLVLLVGASRIVVGAHSLPEVVRVSVAARVRRLL